MNTFSEGLKILLRNVKQKEVALKCGISESQLSSAMNGGNIKMATIDKIVAGTGYKASEIFRKGESEEEDLQSNEL